MPDHCSSFIFHLQESKPDFEKSEKGRKAGRTAGKKMSQVRLCISGARQPHVRLEGGRLPLPVSEIQKGKRQPQNTICLPYEQPDPKKWQKKYRVSIPGRCGQPA